VAFGVSFLPPPRHPKRKPSGHHARHGYNLRIIAQDNRHGILLRQWYSHKTLPADSVQKFAGQKGLLYAHLLGTLLRAIVWRERRALLTGIAPEFSPWGGEKSPMIFTIEPGTAYVGYALATALNVQKGDTIEIEGQSFTVQDCLREAGSEDDVRILVALEDAQKIFGEEGKIGEIQALNCYCVTGGQDPLVLLRDQLAKILPGTTVIQKRAIADARTFQRELMDNYFALILPCLMVVCAIWVGTLAFLNARDRRPEIGILRALGYGSWKIAFLFLGKAVVIGAIGAVIGFILGTGFALAYGAEIFKVTFENVQPIFSLLLFSLIAAPAFTAISSFVPNGHRRHPGPRVCLSGE
jgi:hypothetical protein